MNQRHHLRGISAPLGYLLLMLLSLPACAPQSDIEYFSSVDSLQYLGDIELGLVDTFRQYFEIQQREFANYRKFIEHVKAQHSLALKDIEDYLGNPINAFTLIKRMVLDWNQLHESIMRSEARSEFRKIIETFNAETQVPDEKELHGVILGLARLQEVYNLSAYDVADGIFNGVEYGTQLNWQECFEIATTLFDQKKLSYAIEWFEVTLSLLEEEDQNESFVKFELDTLEYLALAHYDLGDLEKALSYVDIILQVQPDHPVKDTKVYMLRSVPKLQLPVVTAWHSNYTSLCRGIRAPEQAPQRLQCSLTTEGKAYFVLAPLRKEELHLEPEIVLYHGLLNDAQITQLLKESQDLMQRSGVRNGTGTVSSDQRISQTAWLEYNSNITQQIRSLVGEINRLDMRNVENIQVVNYGVGGQYDAHYDFFTQSAIPSDMLGNRISTNMFYLSNVEQGGFTVFPRLNTYLRPEKGAMVRWYNLHRSLDDDYRTLHAGCPVVIGSKRIANIWTHTHYQEFLRPCETERDHYKSIAYA